MLSDDLGAISETPPTLEELLDDLDDPDRKALLATLENPRKQAVLVAKVLAANGYQITAGTIRRWRQAHQ